MTESHTKMQTNITKTHRDISFDAAKGLAIFAVVLIHTINFLEWQNAFLSKIIVSFYMPIFFLISGYFGYTKTKKPKEILTKRFKELIVPYLTIGLIMNIVVHYVFDVDFLHHYILDESKGGFWFLLVLFAFFCCYATSLKISRGKDTTILGILFLFYLVFFVLAFTAPKWAYDAFSLPSLRKFFPFFIGGMLIRKYNQKIQFWSIKSLVISGSVYIILLLIPFNKTISGLVIWSICAFAGCIFIINFFKHIRDRYNLLPFFGRYSITIYIYHYIFMYILKLITPPICQYATKTSTLLLINAIIIISAIAICTVCAFMAKKLEFFKYRTLFGL